MEIEDRLFALLLLDDDDGEVTVDVAVAIVVVVVLYPLLPILKSCALAAAALVDAASVTFGVGGFMRAVTSNAFAS